MKLARYLFILTAVIALTACSSNEAAQSEKNSVIEESDKTQEIAETEDVANDNETISTEKNLFNVEVTLLASMLEGSSQEEIEASAKESGIDDVKFNEDGSVTYKMSDSKHQELLDSMKTGIDESILEMLNDKEAYPSFTEITYNDDCTEFIILCDRSKYSEMDTISALNFYLQGWYYQVFNGVETENLKVIVSYKDKDTDEIIYTGDSSQMGE